MQLLQGTKLLMLQKPMERWCTDIWTRSGRSWRSLSPTGKLGSDCWRTLQIFVPARLWQKLPRESQASDSFPTRDWKWSSMPAMVNMKKKSIVKAGRPGFMTLFFISISHCLSRLVYELLASRSLKTQLIRLGAKNLGIEYLCMWCQHGMRGKAWRSDVHTIRYRKVLWKKKLRQRPLGCQTCFDYKMLCWKRDLQAKWTVLITTKSYLKNQDVKSTLDRK